MEGTRVDGGVSCRGEQKGGKMAFGGNAMTILCPNPECPSTIEARLEGQCVQPAECPRCGASLVVFDDFVLVAVLGEGGMGKVYLAQSLSTGKQFALKRPKLADEMTRRDFQKELQNWIGLPEHPHLLACRFFRTNGPEIGIFADVQDGGSLASWIKEGRLTRLEEILDVAIQFAWGLHAAHERGLVHRDVKPGNVLLSQAGRRAKVSDFGLMRGRAVSGPGAHGAMQGVVVSTTGGTPAYCSPEQLRGRVLTRRTDLWSYGVSLLEVFTGPATWVSGLVAPKVLENYLAGKYPARCLVGMPGSVGDVIRKCLQIDPADRWETMGSVAEALRVSYRKEVGEDYPRPEPTDSIRAPSGPVVLDRMGLHGVPWADPRLLLEKAGGTSASATQDQQAQPSEALTSRRSRALADLVVMDEALGLYEDRIAHNQSYSSIDLMSLLQSKARVLQYLGDTPGAVKVLDRAAALWNDGLGPGAPPEMLVQLSASLLDLGRWTDGLNAADEAIAACDSLLSEPSFSAIMDAEVFPILGSALSCKGRAALHLGDAPVAFACFSRGASVLQQALGSVDNPDWSTLIASLLENKGIAAEELEKLDEAESAFEQAILIRERLVREQGGDEHLAALAGLLNSAANCAHSSKETLKYMKAVGLYSRAEELYRRLVETNGRTENRGHLAVVLVNVGNCCDELDNIAGAITKYQEAIRLFEEAIEQDAEVGLTSELANAHRNLAQARHHSGHKQGAVRSYQDAIGIYRRLLQQARNARLLVDLQNVLLRCGKLQAELGQSADAMASYDEVIRVHEEMRDGALRPILVRSLELSAKAHQARGVLLANQGQLDIAIESYERAIARWQRLVQEFGRSDLQGEVSWDCLNLANALRLAGRSQEARRHAVPAMEILRSEVARTHREDLQHVLEWAVRSLKDVL